MTVRLPNKEQTFALVVWYHPDAQAVERILRYLPGVSGVLVVDNSEESHLDLFKDDRFQSERGFNLQVLSKESLTRSSSQQVLSSSQHTSSQAPSSQSPLSSSQYTPSIFYGPFCENKGIAEALSLGAQWISLQGWSWMLTLDQDTPIALCSLLAYYAGCSAYPQVDRVGVFGVNLQFKASKKSSTEDLTSIAPYSEVRQVMTSGNLVRLSFLKEINFYNRALFIDRVDDDMCIRMHRAGYLVIRLNRILVPHALGKQTRVFTGFCFKNKAIHSSQRMYTMMRNTLYMIKWYPEYKRFYRKKIRTYIKYALRYSDGERKAKIQALWQGYQDFKQGIMGPKP